MKEHVREDVGGVELLTMLHPHLQRHPIRNDVDGLFRNQQCPQRAAEQRRIVPLF